MTLFGCSNPLNIASTDYVDCVVTTVSGALQEQINIFGGWQELASFSTNIPDVNSPVTVSGLPHMDVLKIQMLVIDYSFGEGNGLVLYFNDDFDDNNYGTGNAPYLYDINSAHTYIMEMYILNLANKQKGTASSFLDFNLGEVNSCNLGSCEGSTSQWSNTTDRISSMTFRISFLYGSESGSIGNLGVKIYGMNF